MDKALLIELNKHTSQRQAENLPKHWKVYVDSDKLGFSHFGFYGAVYQNTQNGQFVFSFSDISYREPINGNIIRDIKALNEITMGGELPNQFYYGSIPFVKGVIKMISQEYNSYIAMDYTLSGNYLGAALSELSLFQLKFLGALNVKVINFNSINTEILREKLTENLNVIFKTNIKATDYQRDIEHYTIESNVLDGLGDYNINFPLCPSAVTSTAILDIISYLAPAVLYSTFYGKTEAKKTFFLSTYIYGASNLLLSHLENENLIDAYTKDVINLVPFSFLFNAGFMTMLEPLKKPLGETVAKTTTYCATLGLITGINKINNIILDKNISNDLESAKFYITQFPAQLFKYFMTPAKLESGKEFIQTYFAGGSAYAIVNTISQFFQMNSPESFPEKIFNLNTNEIFEEYLLGGFNYLAYGFHDKLAEGKTSFVLESTFYSVIEITEYTARAIEGWHIYNYAFGNFPDISSNFYYDPNDYLDEL